MGHHFKGRREDGRLITGKGRYTSDWSLPGQLYASFVRADRAHAKILSVDVAAARAHPGVVAVYSGADFADTTFVSPPCMVGYPGRGGSKIINTQRPILARDKVRFVGEEVAVVLAESALIARDAAELVQVEYEDLPAVIGFEAALAAGTLVHEDVPANIPFDYEYGNEVATAAAMASAAMVARVKVESPRVAPNPMETRAVLANWNAQAERYEIRCSNQGGGMMRAALSARLAVPPEKVRVDMVDVGGGFGARTEPYPEYVALLHASRKLGRPIKWVASRSENFLTDAHGRATRLSGEIAMDKDGKFLAIRADWLCDQGAYLTGAGPLTNTSNGNAMGTGAYRIPVAYGRHRLLMTHTTPTNAYRGAGRPDVAYFVERLVDEAAKVAGIDRFEIRRRNALTRDLFPYTTPMGIVYDSGDYPALMARARKESGWDGFEARRAEAARRGMLRGIGLALFVEPAGGGAAPKDQTAIRFDKDGQAQIYTVATSNGQSHETVYPEIVAGIMGIPATDIHLHGSDPDGPALMGSGTIGSRSTQAQGGAFKLGAEEVVRKGLDLASEMLEAAPADVEFKDGTYVVKGTDRKVTMTEVIKKHAGGPTHPLDTTGEVPLHRTFPAGCHIAEVEIDPGTGTTRIIRYTAVDDAGVVINHTLVEAQIQGGMAQGIGQVLGEQVAYDAETGQMLTGSFMDYTMPRAGILGAVQVFDESVPSPTNPLGAKGVGEAGTTGSLPTMMNAIGDALRAAGVPHFDMPATPARVWQAIRSARRAA
jgi:carbon-monoxide dehydrogenase large subunit